MSKYDELVAHFVRDLENGTRPWKKSWKESAGSLIRPLRANGKPYSGMNVLVLWYAAQEKGYASSRWFTFNQAKALGAMVRKGEKASFVSYWGTHTPKKDGESEESAEKSKRGFWKTYGVFNVDQIEGLPESFLPAPIITAPVENRIATAESFAAQTRATIRHGGNRAFYSHGGDFVQMPDFSQFESPEAYYATLFHELTHWTGTPNRVERPKGQKFGDSAYALEELIAELGAAFLCSDLAISDSPREDHSAYLANWAKALKADSSVLSKAASAAEKAVSFLHALQGQEAQQIAA